MQSFFSRNTESLVADLFANYRRHINPNVVLHSIDLCGYGTVQFPETMPNVSFIGGWSDKIFAFMQMYEEQGDTAVAAIEQYTPA